MGSSQHPLVADDGTTAKSGVVDNQSHLVGELVTGSDSSTNNPSFRYFWGWANRLNVDVYGFNVSPVIAQFLYNTKYRIRIKTN